MEDFKHEVQQEEWMFGSIDKLVDESIKIGELTNSPERSQMGLVFMLINQTQHIPMKGKYFTPFIQFKLADLIKQKNLFLFKEDFNDRDINQLMKTIFENHGLIFFLYANLRAEAPDKLHDFLVDALLNTP
jgi:hypothetical protein